MTVERFEADGSLLGYLIRRSSSISETIFVTEHEASLQVGFIVKSSDSEVVRHDHRPLERRIVGTAEVLVVKSGRGEIDVYDNKRSFVRTASFVEGDVLVLLEGGHAFRFSEDTVLLEVKQGPYPGVDEKERF